MTPSSKNDEIRAAKQRRLDDLLLKQAQFGLYTPTYITIEIEDLEIELGLRSPPDPSVPQAEPPIPVVPGGQPVRSATPPTPAPDPGLLAAVPSSHDDPLRDLLDRIKRQWLLAYAIAWLLFALGTMALLNEAFGPSQCLQRLVYALLGLAGGLAILGFSLLPAYRSRYKTRDRLLTLLLTLAVAGLAGWLAYQSCWLA